MTDKATENRMEGPGETLSEDQLRIRVELSRLANQADAHKSFLISTIIRSCNPDKQEDLFKKLESLPNDLLERVLGLSMSKPDLVKKIASDSWNTMRLVSFLEDFSDEQISMCLSLNSEATERFDRFSFEAKSELLQGAKTLTDLQQSILDYKSAEDGSSGN